MNEVITRSKAKVQENSVHTPGKEYIIENVEVKNDTTGKKFDMASLADKLELFKASSQKGSKKRDRHAFDSQ